MNYSDKDLIKKTIDKYKRWLSRDDLLECDEATKFGNFCALCDKYWDGEDSIDSIQCSPKCPAIVDGRVCYEQDWYIDIGVCIDDPESYNNPEDIVRRALEQRLAYWEDKLEEI